MSFSHRAIMAVCYQVQAADRPIRVVLQSELVANEELPSQSGDPRVAAVLERPLEAVEHSHNHHRAILIHRTRGSGLRLAAAADHLIEGAQESNTHTNAEPDWASTTAGTTLSPGQTLTLTKFVAYGWSSQHSVPALRDQVDAALWAVFHTGWPKLVAEQHDYIQAFWQGADVEVEVRGAGCRCPREKPTRQTRLCLAG